MTVFVDNTPYEVSSTHALWPSLVEAVKEGDSETFKELYNPAQTVNNQLAMVGGELEVKNGVVYWNGVEMHGLVAMRILDFVKDGFDLTPMVNFVRNLMANPSNRSREELYPFLEKHGTPLTEEGEVLAYKVVQSNWYSKTAGSLKLLQGKTDDSGHIYNGVGETIECDRGSVDDRANNTCSHGLHVGSLAYSGPGGSFYNPGDRVVIVRFNPKDAVSVPSDHNATKLRVCKYTVVAEYKELNKPVYQSNLDEVDELDDDCLDGTCDCETDNDASVYDVEFEDHISFDYFHKDGTTKRRSGWVDEVNDDHLIVELDSNDPRYNEEESNFREFKFCHISDLEWVS